MQYTFQDIDPFEIVPGYHARMIHTESMTIALVEVEAGAPLPVHAHVHEQVANLLEGEFEMNLGQSLAIPSNVPHSGRAINACKILDVFSPVREDFRARKVDY